MMRPTTQLSRRAFLFAKTRRFAVGEVTQEQLNGLGDRFDRGFDELKNLLRSFDDRIRSVELTQASTNPILSAQIMTIQTQQVEHKKEIDALHKTLNDLNKTYIALNQSMQTFVGWGKWAAGIVAAVIVSGLIFFIGRLIYLVIIGNVP